RPTPGRGVEAHKARGTTGGPPVGRGRTHRGRRRHPWGRWYLRPRGPVSHVGRAWIEFNARFLWMLPIFCGAVEQPGCCLWFTGLSGAGKSTIANVVVDELRTR